MMPAKHFRLIGLVELPHLGLAQVQQAYLRAIRQAHGNAHYARLKLLKL